MLTAVAGAPKVLAHQRRSRAKDARVPQALARHRRSRGIGARAAQALARHRRHAPQVLARRWRAATAGGAAGAG